MTTKYSCRNSPAQLAPWADGDVRSAVPTELGDLRVLARSYHLPRFPQATKW